METTEHITITAARKAAAEVDAIAAQIGIPASQWANQCHRVSLAILRTGRFGPGRVARGTAEGIDSQHSWISLGDPYDPEAIYVDPTWSATVEGKPVIRVRKAGQSSNTPHGSGSIWQWGKPTAGNGPVVGLTPREPLSKLAQMFLDMLGPLDRQGWALLAHAPVEGWPAGEIFTAMDDTRELSALVPIDILGMTTDRNPGELYW